MNAPTLFDPDSTRGRTRRNDPATSVTGARRARVASQKAVILDLLDRVPYVTADELYRLHPETARGTWSSRLGVLVHDGVLVKGDPVPGTSQMVLSYRLADLTERAS